MAKEINHTERRRMVIVKAMRLFAQMGYSKVSFLTLSEATGIARTALYRYFKSKRELFDEAIHEITGGLMVELSDIIDRKESVAVRLELACSQVIDEIYRKREFFLAIFDFVFSMVRAGEDMTGRIALFTDGLKHVYRKLLAEGVRTGEFAEDLNAQEMADVFFAVMESSSFRMLLAIENTSDTAKMRFKSLIRTIRK
ncbi:MAG: TetR/AcrR family transcriptional regulator [Kiritimatiellae bacterium]|nr:TetR/AcrR family transcriptional regulator [Kiritimatiellia bacterium]